MKLFSFKRHVFRHNSNSLNWNIVAMVSNYLISFGKEKCVMLTTEMQVIDYGLKRGCSIPPLKY